MNIHARTHAPYALMPTHTHVRMHTCTFHANARQCQEERNYTRPAMKTFIGTLMDDNVDVIKALLVPDNLMRYVNHAKHALHELLP